MGVQFVHMGSEDRARLHRFIKVLAEEQPVGSVLTPSNWFACSVLPLDSGEIKSHHDLFALLNKIYAARLTGQLQLVLGRVERQLFFGGGQLVFATSCDRQDSLSEMMLREGALTQSQFEEAGELVRTGQRFGSAIAEMGIRTVHEVTGWIQRQPTQITSSVLDYPACRFYFFNSLDKNVVPEIAIAVCLHTAPLLTANDPHRTLFLPLVCFHKLTNCSSGLIDLEVPYFHDFTNRFFRKSFVITFIRLARGVPFRLLSPSRSRLAVFAGNFQRGDYPLPTTHYSLSEIE